MKVNIYTSKGNKKKTGFTLPKDYSSKVNLPLLAQAVRVYEWNSHPVRGKAKTRAEVVATTKKWYRQKGTGNARHGAKSAPIFVGGGKAHGPRILKRSLSLPKKMVKNALLSAISMKAKNGSLFVVEELDKIKKTKEANELIENIISDFGKKAKVAVCLSPKNKKSRLYFRNIKDVKMYDFNNLNAYNVAKSSVLLIDKDSFEKEEKKK